MVGTTRQKIGKDTEDLSSIVNQLDLMDIYRTLHPTTAENTFFSGGHRIVSHIDYMLVHKTIVHKFERTEIKEVCSTWNDIRNY